MNVTNEFTVSNTEKFSLSITDFQITSTGIVNKDTPFEARKTTKVSSPSPARKHFFESFEDLTKWATGAGAGEVGTHAIATVAGDKALGVTPSASAFGEGSWSMLGLNAGAAGVSLATAWQDAGKCLSHDLQVKIRNDQPFYMAGINFKVAGSGDSREFYGISFLRAKKSWSGPSGWYDNDNIPSNLKPAAIWDSYIQDGSNRYYKLTIVLWKRYWDTGTSQYRFTWLAYKLIDSTSYVLDASNYLISWSNLQVRMIEAYPLGFTNGGPSPLLHNAIVVGATSGASARISGTPIMESGSWTVGDASGKLTLTTVSGTFQNGENLLVNGVTRARVSGAIEAKTNYIRVYYGDVNSHGANSTPTDNIRRSNQRNAAIHWPVDNVSDWNASNDYMTLVQWNGVQGSASIPPSMVEANAIIKDSSLLTPNSGTINYSGIALHATGDFAASTYFDDFAIQY